MSACYVSVVENSNTVDVCFYIDHDNILSIGNEMNKIHEEAYMNSYNWDAF